MTKGESWIISRTRKNHPANFKAKVAVSALREDAPISELAVKYGVHATVIHRWKREVLASMEAGFSGKLEKSNTEHEAHLRGGPGRFTLKGMEPPTALTAASLFFSKMKKRAMGWCPDYSCNCSCQSITFQKFVGRWPKTLEKQRRAG